MELEGRPALMLKEWLELEFSAELSGDGFGCYPRHLVAELRSTRRNGDVIARVSAALRAALFRPSGREGEVALAGNFPKKLCMGFWKKRRGEEAADRRVPSCSASTTAIGRRDSSSPGRSRERGQAGDVGAGVVGRLNSETKVAGFGAARHLDQEQERKQRLSPVSVMDFLSQDEDDDGDEDENGNGNGGGVDGDDETASPTFQRSIANIRRASQELLQKIRQFEQLGDLDISDVDDATTATEDVSYNMMETESTTDSDDASAQGILDLLEASTSGSNHCFQKLLVDFFHDDKSPRNLGHGKALLETAQAWLDGQNCLLKPIWAVVKEEIEPVQRWRCFRDDEKKLIAADLESDIISLLVGELVDELY